MTSSSELLVQFISRKGEIDRLAQSLIRAPVFDKSSLLLPRTEPAELGFLQVISWLYVNYYEVGRVGIKFLCEDLAEYDSNGSGVKHFKQIHHFRTFLQHNLDLDKPHDDEIQRSCEVWLRSVCNTVLPDETGWRQCVQAVLADAVEFSSILLHRLRGIERDESRETLISTWLFRLRQYRPPHEFDRLIDIAAADMGKQVDAKKIRERYYNEWIKNLALLAPQHNFDIEARKLIELVLIAEVRTLPITGNDIINTLGISPGPEVGKLLARAKRLYETNPCTGPDLLTQLQGSQTK